MLNQFTREILVVVDKSQNNGGYVALSTPPELWPLATVQKYLNKADTDSQYFVEIPKFQRSIVWKESQIKKLVDSIYKGFPIGSLLAYKTDRVEDGKVVLQLVDGLQRSMAITRYLEEPLKFAPIEEMIPLEFLSQTSLILHGSASEAHREATLIELKSWFHNVTELALGPNYNFSKLAQYLSAGDNEKFVQLIQANADNSVGDLMLGAVLENMKDVRDYKVPVNIYAGPVDNVPTIFERINSQGAQLSKYEILAASWSHTNVTFSNSRVKVAIAEKYKKMIDNGYEIEGFDDLDREGLREYNLYEYLFGLGKVLTQDFPILFHSAEQADENSPVAFQVFTLACKLPVAKMGSLPDYLPVDSGHIVVDHIEAAIMKAAKVAEKSLGQFLGLKLNEQEGGGPSGIKQNQAISFVTSYLANCFDEKFNELPGAAQISKDFAAAIPGHFLLDLIRGSWSGSGDSKLFERTWETLERASDLSGKKETVHLPSGTYLRKVSATSMRDAFSVWHSEQLEAKQSQRVRYPRDFKPVLKFIYSPLVPFRADRGTDFELEHVYPVAVLKRIISDHQLDGLPMAALGNLMLLPKSINRIKGENLLGDYFASLSPAQVRDEEIQSIQNYLIKPDISQIKNSIEMTEDGFKAFCQLRVDAMVSHISNQLGLDA